MKRLRKEFPKKFGMQPGTKVKKKKFTAADLDAAERRGAEKATAKLAAAPPPEISVPPQAPRTEAPPIVPVAAAPAPAVPAPLDIPMSNPPPKIVDEAEIFSPGPPQAAAAAPGQDAPPPPETPPGASATPVPGDGKRYAVMIWGAIVKIFCGIFGDGFQPMVLKSETGEVLYDENVEGVKVWMNYLASIGVKAFSPIVELWLFMSMYVGMRFPLIVAKFRKKKPATTATKAGGTDEPPATEQAPSPAPEKPAPQPPAPAPKQTPAQQAPPGNVELVEVDEEAFR